MDGLWARVEESRDIPQHGERQSAKKDSSKNRFHLPPPTYGLHSKENMKGPLLLPLFFKSGSQVRFGNSQNVCGGPKIKIVVRLHFALSTNRDPGLLFPGRQLTKTHSCRDL
jgi:hypothetical protein